MTSGNKDSCIIILYIGRVNAKYHKISQKFIQNIAKALKFVRQTHIYWPLRRILKGRKPHFLHHFYGEGCPLKQNRQYEVTELFSGEIHLQRLLIEALCRLLERP